MKNDNGASSPLGITESSVSKEFERCNSEFLKNQNEMKFMKRSLIIRLAVNGQSGSIQGLFHKNIIFSFS